MIVLEPFTAADFQQLIGWIDSEALLTSWSGSLFSFPLTIESMQWYVQDTNIPGESDAFVYKAVDSITGQTVGHISLGGISWKNKSSRISRVLVNTANQGKGIGKQMINAVLKIGFEGLGLHRIALGVYQDNKAALNCYLQCGLKIEGISKDILWYNDTYLSMVDMAIMEDEWKALQV